MQETRVGFLGWEDPLEKAMAIHSGILAWRIPWIEKPGRFPVHGVARVGQDLVSKPSPTKGFRGGSDGKESAGNAGDPGSIPESGRSPGEGNGYPLEYSCLENPMDRPWGRKKSDTTERLRLSLLGPAGSRLPPYLHFPTPGAHPATRRSLPLPSLGPLTIRLGGPIHEAGATRRRDPVRSSGGALDVQGALRAAGAEHGRVHLGGGAVRGEGFAEQALHAAARLSLLFAPRLHDEAEERGGPAALPGAHLLQKQLQPRELGAQRGRAAQHEEQTRARLWRRPRPSRVPAARRRVLRRPRAGSPRRRRLALALWRVPGLARLARPLLRAALGLGGRAVGALLPRAVPGALEPHPGAVAGAAVAARGSDGRGWGGRIGRALFPNVLQGHAALILLPELAQQHHLAVALDTLGGSLLLRLGLSVPRSPGGLGPGLHGRSGSLAPLGPGLRWPREILPFPEACHNTPVPCLFPSWPRASAHSSLEIFQHREVAEGAAGALAVISFAIILCVFGVKRTSLFIPWMDRYVQGSK